MAGSASRFRMAGENRFKPTLPLLGRPLISYTFDSFAKTGINKINIVLGFQGAALRTALEPLIPPGLEVSWINNPEWQKQNGISVLAAASQVNGPFLLTMGDHLFQSAIVDLLLRESDTGDLNVAIDRKIGAIFDLQDAMKLQMRGDRVLAIGKQLREFDAIDTGLFVCPRNFLDYLERAKSHSKADDCSLADGVRLMAAAGRVRGIDIGDAWWQDVDNPQMLARAEELLRNGV